MQDALKDDRRRAWREGQREARAWSKDGKARTGYPCVEIRHNGKRLAIGCSGAVYEREDSGAVRRIGTAFRRGDRSEELVIRHEVTLKGKAARKQEKRARRLAREDRERFVARTEGIQ